MYILYINSKMPLGPYLGQTQHVLSCGETIQGDTLSSHLILIFLEPYYDGWK